MKKNYFMLVCLVLFMAVKSAAQVSSAADLYGDYKFTADVEYTNDGLAYKEMLSGDCDAKIESDATYQGKISGFAGAQNALNIFKVNVADNTFLDHKNKSAAGYGYCVFGKVTEGMEVVKKIEAVETCQRQGYQDVPYEEVKIIKVTRA